MPLFTVMFVFFQVLTNAVWYVTNEDESKQEASQHLTVKPMPAMLHIFKDRDDFRHKKVKRRQLSSTQRQSHAQVL